MEGLAERYDQPQAVRRAAAELGEREGPLAAAQQNAGVMGICERQVVVHAAAGEAQAGAVSLALAIPVADGLDPVRFDVKNGCLEVAAVGPYCAAQSTKEGPGRKRSLFQPG